MTQSELESATNLPRSTISDTLALLLEMKMVKQIKRPGDRKKYYFVIQSWDSRIISRLKVNSNYARIVKARMGVLMMKITNKIYIVF